MHHPETLKGRLRTLAMDDKGSVGRQGRLSASASDTKDYFAHLDKTRGAHDKTSVSVTFFLIVSYNIEQF